MIAKETQGGADMNRRSRELVSRQGREVMPYNHGALIPPDDRAVAARAKETFDRTRTDGFAIDSRMALGKHYAAQAADLDDYCRERAGDNPRLKAILDHIEHDTLAQTDRIFNGY